MNPTVLVISATKEIDRNTLYYYDRDGSISSPDTVMKGIKILLSRIKCLEYINRHIGNSVLPLALSYALQHRYPSMSYIMANMAEQYNTDPAFKHDADQIAFDLNGYLPVTAIYSHRFKATTSDCKWANTTINRLYAVLQIFEGLAKSYHIDKDYGVIISAFRDTGLFEIDEGPLHGYEQWRDTKLSIRESDIERIGAMQREIAKKSISSYSSSQAMLC